MNNRTIKEYIKWIITTFEKLQPYDSCAYEGNKKLSILGSNDQNYCMFYISPYLVLNIFEFFKIFYRYKNGSITLDQLKSALFTKFKIDYDKEPKEILDQIMNSKLFTERPMVRRKGVLSSDKTFYEILKKSRNDICHSNFFEESYFSGTNLFDQINEIIAKIIE